MKQLSATDVLERLIGFESVSRNSNLNLIEFVRNYLSDYGIQSTLAFNKDDDRANLYATIGPDDRGGVMLSGHTDVVPVVGQDWSSDPFRLKQTEDRVIGRGACDMKGFIASVLAVVPKMTEKPLQTPIHLAFSYDEEIGCVGVQDLVDKLKHFEVLPRLGVIGEPTSMRTVVGHKGKRSFRVVLTGLSCHSAFITDGVNAVEFAAELIVYIKQMNQKLKDQGRTDSGYQVNHTTFHTGVINGGTALNIVPKQCHFDFEIRHLPQDDIDDLVLDIQTFALEELLPKMRHHHAQCDITFEALSAYPGLHNPKHSNCAILMDSINQHPCQSDKISFGTEAGIFQQQLDIDCVVCGPGSIAQAHKPDEFVSLDQLDSCHRFLGNLIIKCQNHTV